MKFMLVLLLCVTASPLSAGPFSAPGVATPQDAVGLRDHRLQEARMKAGFYSRKSEADALESKTFDSDRYDVLYYDLDLDLRPDSKIILETVTMRARVSVSGLDVAELHLGLNMMILEVRSGGTVVDFRREGNVVSVNLDRVYCACEVFTLDITCVGNPDSMAFGWGNIDGVPWIWTLSEPYGARSWWPCKDDCSDKADSVSIRVTVPEGLVVASNGLLRSEVDNGDTRTFHWVETHPIATYLVGVTAGPFATFSEWYHYSPTDSMEIACYVLPDLLEEATEAYAITDDILAVFAAAFGEYPFIDEKYGHVQYPWWGGVEHQTIASLRFDAMGSHLISHEAAHQWWGDSVGVADFHHIWINEGFATWAEALWREQTEGTAAYHEEMAAAAWFGPGTIYVEDPVDFDDIFDLNLSYNKASWVVHMLRHIMGDEDFFFAMKGFQDEYRDRCVVTEDLQVYFGAISDRYLYGFFQSWIYGEYFPRYELAWDCAPDGDSTRVFIDIDQVQTNAGVFSMPVDLRIHAGGQIHDFVVENNTRTQRYERVVANSVSAVELDPDDWILCEKIYTDLGAVAPRAVTGRLLPSVPNPFNPATTIGYNLASAGHCRIAVYDVGGRLVRTLLDDWCEAGDGTVVWDGRDALGAAMPSGIYFSRLTGDGFADTGKMSLVR